LLLLWSDENVFVLCYVLTQDAILLISISLIVLVTRFISPGNVIFIYCKQLFRWSYLPLLFYVVCYSHSLLSPSSCLNFVIWTAWLGLMRGMLHKISQCGTLFFYTVFVALSNQTIHRFETLLVYVFSLWLFVLSSLHYLVQNVALCYFAVEL